MTLEDLNKEIITASNHLSGTFKTFKDDIEAKPNVEDIPTNMSQLTDDIGYATNQDVQDAVADYVPLNKTDGNQNSVKASFIGNESTLTLNPWGWSEIKSTSNGIQQGIKITQQGLEIYRGDIASYNLNSPSGLATTDYVGSVVKDPVNVSLETKDCVVAGTFTGNFLGKQIQRYNATNATSGTITITNSWFVSSATDIVPTIELHIPVNGEVTTINLNTGLNIIDIPEKLEFGTGATVTYHVFVLRAEKDLNGTWCYYINYAYKYDEVEV